MNIVRVALAVPLPRFFDYLYSPDLTPIVGGRVLVPFGSQKRVGIVVDLPASSDVAKEKLLMCLMLNHFLIPQLGIG